MTLTIELDSQLERRLQDEVAKSGLKPAEVARQLIEKGLPPSNGSHRSNPLAELFAEWEAEDATSDPEEIARREREWEEFKQNLNENRRLGGEARIPLP